MPCRCIEQRVRRGPASPASPAPPVASRRRRTRLSLTGLTAVLALAACGTPLPPIQLVRLPAEPPAAAPLTVARPELAITWQLMAPVSLPGHLDRDALLVPQGLAGVQPLGGARWAEPLRDAAPRLLRHDLERQLGQPVWAAPLPPGVGVTHQLRVDIGALDVAADGRSVRVQARWSVADVRGAVPPRPHEASFVTPSAGTDADALASAHRLALWTLAGRIAASTGR